MGCFAVAIQSCTSFSNSSVVVAATISINAFAPPASARWRSPLSNEAKGSLSFHSGCSCASAFTVSEYDIGEQVLPAPWFVDNVRTYSILTQIFGPIQRFPQRLKSVRIIAFAFLLDGGVSEAAYRGAIDVSEVSRRTPTAPLPGFVAPMQAMLVDSIRPGDWIYEILSLQKSVNCVCQCLLEKDPRAIEACYPFEIANISPILTAFSAISLHFWEAWWRLGP